MITTGTLTMLATFEDHLKKMVDKNTFQMTFFLINKRQQSPNGQAEYKQYLGFLSNSCFVCYQNNQFKTIGEKDLEEKS